jgi:hypothetical protein
VRAGFDVERRGAAGYYLLRRSRGGGEP